MAEAVNTHPAASLLATHAWKNATISIEDEERDVCLFDWYALEAEDAAKVEKGRALPAEQQDSYFSHAQLWTADFDQYFSGEHAEKIEDGEWLPLGVLGMGNATTLENFAEMNNDGFLAIVLGGDGKPGSVIWYNQDDDEVRVVADSVAELEVELAEGDSDDGDDDE